MLRGKMPDTDTDKDGDRVGHIDKWRLEHHVRDPLAISHPKNKEICSGLRRCGERSGFERQISDLTL